MGMWAQGGSGGALGTIGLGLRPESRSGTRSRIAPTCGALLAVAEREGRGTGRAGPEEKGKRAATGWSLGHGKKKGRVGWQRKEKEKKRELGRLGRKEEREKKRFSIF